MQKINLLAIAPYEGLAEILRNYSKNQTNISLTVETGDLNNALEIANEHINDNFDAIISRGGTADLLRSKVNIPVIEISISVYDVLRAIKMAELYNAKFAIAGFSTITDCAKLLCDLLQYNIEIITFNSEKDVYPAMSNLKERNYDLVLCDMIGSTIAGQLNLNNILISSGSESVHSSLNKAIELVQSLSVVTKQKEIFKSITTKSKDNLIVYDVNHNIWFSNIVDLDMKETIFNILSMHFKKILTTDTEKIEEIMEGYVFTITSYSVSYNDEQYTAVRISKKKIPLHQEGAFSIYNSSDDNSNLSDFESSSANYIGLVRKKIEEYSYVRYPVLILGEKGTGKNKAASIIYKNGPFNGNPLYTIDCSKLTSKQWNSLLLDDNSPFYSVETTLFFKEITSLELHQFNKLIDVIIQTNLSHRNRLIFSILTDDSIVNEEILNYLKNDLACLQLHLPPLRERVNELSSITTLYINKLNTILGKQIIGLEPEALVLMKEYSWKNNLNQLYRVMKELVILEESYISKETVKEVLSQEKESSNHSETDTLLDLTKTLDEINYDVIQVVLEEEKQNKERTANRLGISRSTLWRKINAYSNDS